MRDAVASGRIDERFVKAARAAARGKVGGRPSPSGAPRWSDEDIDDLVLEMVTRVKPDKVVLAAEKAVNDREFARWLTKALVTQLDLAARSTVTGRIIRALDDALGEEPDRFQLTNGCWGLVDGLRDPGWAEGISSLVSIAHTVPTRVVRISPVSEKTPPLAYRPDIREVVAKVLETAGPLQKATLADVLSARFDGSYSERLGYLDDDELGSVLGGEDEGELSDGVLAARWMLTQLTAGERGAGCLPRTRWHSRGGQEARPDQVPV